MSSYMLKVLFTVLALLTVSAMLAVKVILETKRDLHPIALAEQANITSTRKERETAVYRNFTVPPGFPLTTGMGLSLGYRLRNGNFGDLWSSIMDLSSENYVELQGRKHPLATINGEAKQLVKSLQQESSEPKRLGICVPVFGRPGFVLVIAGLMGSLQEFIPFFLPSVPRSKQDLQILAIESWETFRQMNGSHEWYQKVIVCDSKKFEAPSSIPENIVTLEELLADAEDDRTFKYTPPQDNSDDLKVMAINVSPFGTANSFTHMALVSSVAAFIKSFPLHNELSSHDHLSIILEDDSVLQDAIQILPKLLATLLHGGSASLTSSHSFNTLEKCMSRNTTLLQIPENCSLLDSQLNFPLTVIQKARLALASNFLSEGVFTSTALMSPAFEKLRCVYLASKVKNVRAVALMDLTVAKPTQESKKRARSTEFLNRMRALLGCRAVVELYCPFVVLGPVASTNFFDYRVFPQQVDGKFTNCGPVCTSLEAKLVEDDNSQDYDILKRQGMLCIRGFTIGKPVESAHQKKALEVVEKFDGGEGWMPMLGVFCLWGKDGCLYEYK
ncbi:LAME_0H09560g1_1 [Lachancea meyersii CBS 8951]|uniref:LAME_0H09560g1_1 n=1 Tax=Lachancea meyersii CBS 8951 TaxID=1266667 RepID=A0A1G4KG56_9SACH|nr:LAME_0H09560g1_1 [Lachancea meyersii CBS 8951]